MMGLPLLGVTFSHPGPSSLFLAGLWPLVIISIKYLLKLSKRNSILYKIPGETYRSIFNRPQNNQKLLA
jgi:hypothetical protein